MHSYYAFQELKIAASEIDLVKMADEIEKEYPLLAYLQRSNNEVEWKEALLYVMAKFKSKRKK